MHEACMEQGKVPLIVYMSSLISSRLSPMDFLTNYRLEWLWQIACYHCLIVSKQLTLHTLDTTTLCVHFKKTARLLKHSHGKVD